MSEQKQGDLRHLPSISELLKAERVRGWVERYGATQVTGALREAVDVWRRRLREGQVEVQRSKFEGRSGEEEVRGSESEVRGGEGMVKGVLATAEDLLERKSRFAVRRAINGTGIILHTGLGRAVLSGEVVDSVMPELKGCSTMAIDPETGERAERDELIEPLLCELTGAEAGTVVNNNAAATLIVLKALAEGGEVIVSRGQLIEIGGSFRLPEVMAQSGARLVEVGATNRTHLRDYERAITEQTRAILRVHPSNYRIVGFTCQPELAELTELARRRNTLVLDDLGAGALVDLRRFGLPYEPTVQESVRQGADVVLFSGDKLLGASQAGVIVGRAPLVARVRKHPLMRAVRVDKTCLMLLERTLRLFRQPEELVRRVPTYAMVAAPVGTLEQRARGLARQIEGLGVYEVEVKASEGYLGSGALPVEAIPSVMLRLSARGIGADELSRRLRQDVACVFGRIEDDGLCLDLRTIAEGELPLVLGALQRVAASCS